jgi:hypothetical protein
LGIGLLLAALATPVVADSDGDYCTTSTYLAYETRLPGSAPHQLHVVSLESPLSQKSKRSVDLPDFQVHGLLCSDFEILVLGWDSLLTVTVEPSKPPSVRSEKLAYGGYRPSLFGPPHLRRVDAVNLGSLAYAKTIRLTTPESTFRLVIQTTPTDEPCRHHVVSSLEEVDHEGLVRFSLALYDGSMSTDGCCGE